MLGVIIGASLVFAREPQLTKVWSKTYDTEVGGYDAAVPDWNNPAAVKSQAGMRNAIGVGGKLYGVDMRTMSVTEFDSDGFRKAYSLPSLAGRSITYTALDNSGALTTAPDFYGSLITCDEAGHLLIGHGYGTGATCNNWTVLDRATGDTKHLSVDFGEYAKACQPTEIIGRAIGDVTIEGYLFVPPTSIYWPTIKGLPWVTPQEIQRAKILSFSGDGTVGSSAVTGEISSYLSLGDWVRNICAPRFSNLENTKAAIEADSRVNIQQGFVMHSKASCTARSIDVYGGTFGRLKMDGSFVEGIPCAMTDLEGYNFSPYSAFDVFQIDGDYYFVSTYSEKKPDDDNVELRFAVYDHIGYVVDSWTIDEPWTDTLENIYPNRTTAKGSCNINIEKIDGNNVNIYIWAQTPGGGVTAAMYHYGYDAPEAQ